MANTVEDEYPWLESSKPDSRGAFIVIEGLDRAGKTTQVKRLCDSLYASGRNVKRLRFPDRTTSIGQMINSYLQSSTSLSDQTIHLLFSANRWEKAEEIRDLIAKGYTIVCDRYYYSGMVYTSAKYLDGSPKKLDLKWCKNPEVGLPKPDLVVFLDLEAEEAEKRGGYGEEKYEEKSMQKRVREGFLGLRNGQLGFEDEARNMRVLDAGKAIDEVADGVWDVVQSLLRRNDLGELGTVR
ncbi:thymidylate kinase protein [Rutstroemia sp. NJR-2017a BBW]|nr:thymidylate kinase protein [Rutstroemia sp. NJR-2017a BBW]